MHSSIHVNAAMRGRQRAGDSARAIARERYGVPGIPSRRKIEASSSDKRRLKALYYNPRADSNTIWRHLLINYQWTVDVVHACCVTIVDSCWHARSSEYINTCTTTKTLMSGWNKHTKVTQHRNVLSIIDLTFLCVFCIGESDVEDTPIPARRSRKEERGTKHEVESFSDTDFDAFGWQSVILPVVTVLYFVITDNRDSQCGRWWRLYNVWSAWGESWESAWSRLQCDRKL